MRPGLRTLGKWRSAMPRCTTRIRLIDRVVVLDTFEWDPPLRPGSDFMQGAFELAALIGELVFDANGGIRDHPAGYQFFRFQRSEPFGEHSIGNVGNGPLEECIPGLSLKESLDDSARPPAADELDSAVEPRANRGNDLSHDGNLRRLVLDTSNLLKYTTFYRVSPVLVRVTQRELTGN
jgi:hypothetical protein